MVIMDYFSCFVEIIFVIKVGLPVAGQPPRRSLRAVLPHRAPLNGRAVELARWVSSVGEFPRVVLLVGFFYDMRVGDGECFPHLTEARPVEA